MERLAIEASDSLEAFLERHPLVFEDDIDAEEESRPLRGRVLTHHHQHQHRHQHRLEEEDSTDFDEIEQEEEAEYLHQTEHEAKKARKKARKKHEKLLKEMYADPGIRHSTVHGMMIDAGSTGSRLHLYEWEPRVLTGHREVQNAVAGKKLSFPESNSRWTDRLRPGIASFASLPDNELVPAIAAYLDPLIGFAKAVLREKEQSFESFPIYFRATAGMRTLDREDRFRVLGAIRTLFSNNTFCPFYFEDEYARILSGEEEAIFGWAGINFVMGNLIEESTGAGTVLNPRLTYGALDMGGASTQISFYEPNEDVMANLFKLQIGQGKHWNLYAHSFLYFGLNEARHRFESNLIAGHNDTSRLVDGINNPCLPGGSRKKVRLSIHHNNLGQETWDNSFDNLGSDYQAVLKNDAKTGDFNVCMEFAKGLLHLEDNAWCNFAHRGECAFNGVAMSKVPKQSEHFGEFLAFSNYYHVWEFLGLQPKASLQELYNATQTICSMSKDEIFLFNQKTAQQEDFLVEDYCFRSAYVFNILRYGYGFQMDDRITATKVIGGHKVGWALGAMLYEINTFPWEYVPKYLDSDGGMTNNMHTPKDFFPIFLAVILFAMFTSVALSFYIRGKRARDYEPIKESTRLLA